MFKLLEILVIIMFILVFMLNVIYVIQSNKDNSLTSISKTLNIGILFLIVMYLICLNFKLDFKGPSEPDNVNPQTIKVVYEGLK